MSTTLSTIKEENDEKEAITEVLLAKIIDKLSELIAKHP